MGDAQSAQREDRNDAEEESGAVDDAQTEHNAEDKPLKDSGQFSELTGKADTSIAEVNGHCEGDIAGAILSPDEDISETEKPLKEEELPLDNVEINEKESPNEADKVPLEMIEMDAKQNDINESFRRFFSNIGLKLTLKRGSGETEADVPDETNKEEPNQEPNGPEDIEDTTKETTSENAEQHNDMNIAQEPYDNDSTTCPTLTDVTSEDVLENAEEKRTETKEEVESDNVDVAMTSIEGEHAHLDATPEEEPHSTSPSSPEEEGEVVSPIKRFFTTGIFSGLRKKKKPAEDETADKELEDFGKKEVEDATEQPLQDEQQDKEEIGVGVETAAIDTKHKENDPSTIIVTEPEILSSQEDKVQASPLKRLLSGSSFKKISKKQRGRKSSDAKLSDSGEHASDRLQSSTESSEKQKEEVYAHSSTEAAVTEDGAWASLKKLMTPKKHIKRPSLSNEETQITGSVEEQKSSEGGQISDLSTEEGKKRKDSSVSWDSVLCGSGRRRSRKTSDSEEETPKNDNDINKQDSRSKHGAESSLEGSNEINEIIAYSPKQEGSPSEGDGGSTWKSLKRLVTPKRKARDVDESRDNVQSDSEATQDETSFSIKKLLPGRKKRKSAEKQDQVSSDEADKDVASADEDSETPAVVPLSEFDILETEVHIETQADVETHIPMEVDLLDEMAEPVLLCDSLQIDAEKIQDKGNALESKAPATPSKTEEPDDLTDSSSNQQLSDIPEEATPASATEEAARDDTIAEDLIEITSEAFTAPEPLDTTLADETEMISAVSQLSSESSKTSGNTTPVPAEYDVKETDALLNQVVETISMSPTEVPVCSEEVRSERISVSVSHQVMETFEKEEPTILEIHRRLDATSINTNLNVEELGAINEFAATTQTESLSVVNDSVSTEVVSEVPTEEFNTPEIAADDIYEVNVTYTEEIVKELDSIDECQDVVECLYEDVAVSTDKPDGDKIVPDEGSLVDAHETETEPPKMDSKEEELTATAADETKDGTMEQEVKEETVPLTDVKIEPADVSITEHVQEPEVLQNVQEPTEAEGLLSLENEVIEDIPAVETVTDDVQASTLDSEEGSGQSPVEEVKSEDIPPEETGIDEPKQTVEVIVEPEASILQSLEKEVITEDVPEEKTVTDQPKEEAIPLSEVKLEPVDASKTEHVQEPEVLQAVQVATLDSEAEDLLSLEKEVISEDIPAVEKLTDEPNQETEVRVEPEEKLPVNAAKTEQVHEPEVLPSDEKDTATETKTDEGNVITERIGGGSAQELEKQILFEDVPKPDTDNVIASVTDGIESEVVAELDEALEIAEDQETEGVQQDDLEDCLPEVVDELQTLTAVCVASEEAGHVQVLEKTVFTGDTTPPCADSAAVTNEPKHEVHVSEVQVSVEREKESELPDTEIETAAIEHDEVCASSVHEEPNHVQVLEETTAPCVDSVAVTSEPKHEVHVSEVQVSVERQNESELPDTEIKTAEACVSSVHEEANNVQVLEKTVFTEKTTPPCADSAAVTCEPKHEVHVSEVQVSVEKEKESELPDTEIKTAAVEHEVVCASSVHEEPSHVQVLEETTALCVDSAAVTSEPKHEVHVSEVQDSDERENESELPDTEIKTAEACVSPVHEEASHVQVIEKTVFTEETTAPCADSAAVTSEPKHEVHVSEVQVSVEKEKENELPDTEIKTAAVEHDVVCASSVHEEPSHVQVLEEITPPCVDSAAVTSEPKHEVHISEVQVSDERENESELPDTEIKTAAVEHDVVCASSVHEEPSHNQVLEETTAPCVDSVAVTSEPKHEVHVSEVQVSVEREKESELPDTEIKTAAAEHAVVCVSSVHEEASNVQVLEKTVFTEYTTPPCVEDAAVTSEPKHEVHVSAVQVSVEGERERELPDVEMKTVAVEYAAVMAQVVMCNLKDVSVALPDVLIEETTTVTEPLIDSVTSELVLKKEVETATPVVKDDVAEAAGEGSKVVMMHIPSVEFEDNGRIQVQVVDVDKKSAEAVVDTVLEAGVTEAKEVITVCHATIKKAENFSATSEIEEEFINEENTVTIQEVIENFKENLPEAVPELMVVNLEQEGIKEPDVVSEVSMIVEKESNEVEDQKAMEDGVATFRERQDEAPAVICDEKQVSKDLMQTPDVPGSSEVSIHDQKEDLEETKAEQEKSAGEVRSSSEELDAEKINEEAQITQFAQSPTVTPSSTGVVVPQNTGIISSEGNVESTSSVSPPPTTEPVKKTEVSEDGVQASEPVTQGAENQKQTEQTEVAVLETEITKPAANLDSTERAVTMNQPIQLDVSIQEPVEQIQSTERVTSSVQATETIQPVSQAEKREELLSQQVLSEAFHQETKAEEPVQQKEEENDQDVWMDAEEDIYTQEETKVSLCEVDEPLEPQTESKQEDKPGLEHEVEMTPNPKTEEEESQKEMHKTADTCEIDSEGEDFAVAFEHPETAIASISMVKWN